MGVRKRVMIWVAVMWATAAFVFGHQIHGRPEKAPVADAGAVQPASDGPPIPGDPAIHPPGGALNFLGRDERTTSIPVFRTSTRTVETPDLRSYLIGVVAGEMPADYPLEALKAQAIAARTYVLWARDHSVRALPEGAWVEDGEGDQVYVDEAALRARWKAAFDERYARIARAVDETAGMILVYDGAPILSTFFALSNGRTEDAAAYWSKPVDYLVSVPSAWDEAAPDFRATAVFSRSEVLARLGMKDPGYGPADAAASGAALPKIVERTRAGYVAKVAFGPSTFTGRFVRERLGLRSASFDVEDDGRTITFITYGHGHGVGMSQWGAKAMAEAGYGAAEILAHYYPGTRLLFGVGEKGISQEEFVHDET
ncbi:MAG: stage II sporulation protein D [Hydrogenibacillus sp.]|nr:stage II sporulation protein D [Hydrogenibacillus sp.]